MEIQRISISSLFVKLLSISLKALKYLQDQMTEKQDWAHNVGLRMLKSLSQVNQNCNHLQINGTVLLSKWGLI